MDLKKYFVKSELVPVVVQHADTGDVLMLGYANEESLRLTLETGTVWFFSRSRQTLWNKGESSGNFLFVHELWGDCDDDTILIKAYPKGPTCHTGSNSCFFKKIDFTPKTSGKGE